MKIHTLLIIFGLFSIMYSCKIRHQVFIYLIDAKSVALNRITIFFCGQTNPVKSGLSCIKSAGISRILSMEKKKFYTHTLLKVKCRLCGIVFTTRCWSYTGRFWLGLTHTPWARGVEFFILCKWSEFYVEFFYQFSRLWGISGVGYFRLSKDRPWTMVTEVCHFMSII